MSGSDKKKSYRIDEVAKEFDVSKRSIERIVARGDLKVFKQGHTPRILADELARFVMDNSGIREPKRKAEKGLSCLSESLGEPCRRFKGSDFCLKAIVYAWVRGEEILYIGFSAVGLGRPFTTKHEALQFCKPDDELLIWSFDTIEAALQAEDRLIQEIKPPYNGLNHFRRSL